MKKILSIALFSCLLTGCRKDWAKQVALAILQPDYLDAGASSPAPEIDKMLSDEAAQAAWIAGLTPPTLQQQDACDPSDSDGDPYDDGDCPDNPNAPK